MDPREAAPGTGAAAQTYSNLAHPSEVSAKSVAAGASLEHYLRLPDAQRIGICCSGGGIRSASYTLGALQALRRAGVLGSAEYLSCVSGGGYTAIAHTVLESATVGDFERPISDSDDERAARGRAKALHEEFDPLPAWALGSPEEAHLRDHPNYLAPGSTGKVWLFLNLIYGVVRHLIPFAAGIVLAGIVLGFLFHRWLGPSIQGPRKDFPNLWPPSWIAISLALAALACLFARQWTQNRASPSGAWLHAIQTWALLLVRSSVVTAVLLVALPALIWAFSLEREKGLPAAAVEADPTFVIPLVGSGIGVTTILGALSYLARRGVFKRLVPILTALLAPLLLLIPFVGVTYWVTQDGVHWNPQVNVSGLPPRLAVLSAVVLVLYAFLDEVTSNMHLFYRERLAASFIGRRVRLKRGRRTHAQLPWSLSLPFSKVWPDDQRHFRNRRRHAERLPKLVVCAAVNLGEEVPPGRNAASFTFERDYSGGPTTGYTTTQYLEERAGEGVLTLPAMMGISGAALSPSMGRLTRPGLRLLLALFNVRLGVWLPNPRQGPHLRTSQLRARLEKERRWDPRGDPRPDHPLKRPGALYILREALGANSLRHRHVYVTDGGHWENLGLVELLRRGCTQIVCLDAAGDDLRHFHTLSQAIALARSDLGVQIDIDLKDLIPEKGKDKEEYSRAPVVTGRVRYPTGHTGVLVFAKASLQRSSPQDLISFRQIDPKFPTHSTADQFFNERKYEAYRTLGYHAGVHAVRKLNTWREANGHPLFPRAQLRSQRRA